MPKKKDAPKKAAKQESGHKANKEGMKIPMTGAGPDEKSKKMHMKAAGAHEKPSIPYGKHPMNAPAGPHKHVNKKKKAK